MNQNKGCKFKGFNGSFILKHVFFNHLPLDTVLFYFFKHNVFKIKVGYMPCKILFQPFVDISCKLFFSMQVFLNPTPTPEWNTRYMYYNPQWLWCNETKWRKYNHASCTYKSRIYLFITKKTQNYLNMHCWWYLNI